ncbi:MAG: tail fiber domain-containing protein [Deltaproteobacteria bacterium]|nr:tail fiber domain-containing protein [Deltaproteobacteria bacterium]
MNRIKKISMALVLLAGLYASAAAAEEPVAEVLLSAEGVELITAGEYERMILKVATPTGEVIYEEFSGNELPAFYTFIDYGVPLTDGHYKWELVAASQVFDRRTLAEAARQSPVVNGGTSSGAFMILAGEVVTETLPEELNRDVVHLDDTIVDGSLCAGFDCVDGEAFGYDTLRLKENNLQIHFDDTSASASFPANDWRLIANETTNGGLNMFAISDATAGVNVIQVEAGAGANAVYVDDAGRVGFGTSTPVVELHSSDGDTPTLRLEQNGSSGWSPQTWDVAGNETNWFVRDVTNGSTLPLRVRPNAPSSSIDIAGRSGNVGMGTGSPSADLHVRTTAADDPATVLLDNANPDPDVQGKLSAEAASVDVGSVTAWPLNIVTEDVVRVTVDATGNTGFGVTTPQHLIDTAGGAYCDGNTWIDASSRELKEDIAPLSCDEALDVLAGLDPVTFNYKNDSGEQHVGFIAEDVPELVATADRKGMSAMDVAAVLTSVVQEQQRQIEAQWAEINELREKVAELER